LEHFSQTHTHAYSIEAHANNESYAARLTRRMNLQGGFSTKWQKPGRRVSKALLLHLMTYTDQLACAGLRSNLMVFTSSFMVSYLLLSGISMRWQKPERPLEATFTTMA
jgi:hypothetical protein